MNISGIGVRARVPRILIFALLLFGFNTLPSAEIAQAAASCTNATASISGGTKTGGGGGNVLSGTYNTGLTTGATLSVVADRNALAKAGVAITIP